MHANNLRKYHVRVDEVVCDNILLDSDCLECPETSCNGCSIIYENDCDFGEINTLELRSNSNHLLPSQRVNPDELAHLTIDQRNQVMQIIDNFPEVFSETPGLCNVGVYHEIPIAHDFEPRRLRAYRVPENLKFEVDRQIDELLKLGFIEPSTSPMASPIVCCLKGRDGGKGVRIAVDYIGTLTGTRCPTLHL